MWRVEKEAVRVLAGAASDRLPVSADLNIASEQSFRP